MIKTVEDMATHVHSENGNLIPKFGTPPAKPGIYIAFFHGRHELAEAMTDWGFDGPQIGPLEWFHTVYSAHIRIQFLSREDEGIFFTEPHFPDAQDIFLDDDLAYYAGAYYSDWAVYYIPSEETEKPFDSFRPIKRRKYNIAQKNKIKAHDT